METEIDFRHLVGGFPSGVTVVTTLARDGEPYGFTATAFSSVSLEPPLVLVCLDVKADCHPAFSDTDNFAVNVLAEGQRDLALRFATRGIDKFGGLAVSRGEHVGAPLVGGAAVHIECRMHARHATGDHTLMLGEVLGGRRLDLRPLLYYARAFGRFEPHG